MGLFVLGALFAMAAVLVALVISGVAGSIAGVAVWWVGWCVARRIEREVAQ